MEKHADFFSAVTALNAVEAATGNDGAFALDGQMVDKPVVERARAMLAKAR